MAGVRRKSFGFREDSKTSSSLPHNSKQQTTSSTPGISRISLHLNSAKQTASSTPGIPRIGLHLNSVASIPLDRFVQDVLPSASQHSVNMSSSIISSGNMQNKLHNSMSAEKSQESDVQGLLIVQDCDTLPSDVGKSDDLSHSSPKNKKYVFIVITVFLLSYYSYFHNHLFFTGEDQRRKVTLVDVVTVKNLSA